MAAATTMIWEDPIWSKNVKKKPNKCDIIMRPNWRLSWTRKQLTKNMVNYGPLQALSDCILRKESIITMFSPFKPLKIIWSMGMSNTIAFLSTNTPIYKYSTHERRVVYFTCEPSNDEIKPTLPNELTILKNLFWPQTILLIVL